MSTFSQDTAQYRKLADALASLQEAIRALSEAWEDVPGDAIAPYPDYLPSFDEFVFDALRMSVR